MLLLYMKRFLALISIINTDDCNDEDLKCIGVFNSKEEAQSEIHKRYLLVFNKQSDKDIIYVHDCLIIQIDTKGNKYEVFNASTDDMQT